VSGAGGWFARLGASQRLALVAIVLGLGALAIGSLDRGGKVTLDTRELAAIVEGEVDHVTPEELADWLIEGRQDFRLVDLRPESDFESYHIPGAARIAIPDLEAAGLPRNEKIVLYSEEGIHSAQAWMLLKARKYPGVYILLGGLAGWKDHVLFPVRPAEGAPVAERAAFARAAEIARHFGGTPRAAAAGGEAVAAALPTPETPKVVAPVAPPPGAKPGAKRKKEGC